MTALSGHGSAAAGPPHQHYTRLINATFKQRSPYFLVILGMSPTTDCLSLWFNDLHQSQRRFGPSLPAHSEEEVGRLSFEEQVVAYRHHFYIQLSCSSSGAQPNYQIPKPEPQEVSVLKVHPVLTSLEKNRIFTLLFLQGNIFPMPHVYLIKAERPNSIMIYSFVFSQTESYSVQTIYNSY